MNVTAALRALVVADHADHDRRLAALTPVAERAAAVIAEHHRLDAHALDYARAAALDMKKLQRVTKPEAFAFVTGYTVTATFLHNRGTTADLAGALIAAENAVDAPAVEFESTMQRLSMLLERAENTIHALRIAERDHLAATLGLHGHRDDLKADAAVIPIANYRM